MKENLLAQNSTENARASIWELHAATKHNGRHKIDAEAKLVGRGACVSN